jgi:hypothetical protein
MTNGLETVIINLERMGVFSFLPFLLTSAVFYGLLRRSKLFGDPDKNVAVNAIVALVSAFMVWAYPIITGTSIQEYQQFFSSFFFKGTIATVTVIIGLLIANMFFPQSLGASLEKSLQGRFGIGIVVLGLLIGGGIFLSSGAGNFFGFSMESLDKDLIYSIIFLAVFFGIIGFIVFITGKESKEVKK